MTKTKFKNKILKAIKNLIDNDKDVHKLYLPDILATLKLFNLTIRLKKKRRHEKA
jgi:hypothetical protein